MYDQVVNRKLTLWAMVGLAIAALVAVVFGVAEMGHEKYDIVVFGDSIIGNYRTPGCAIYHLEKESEYTVLNAAFGGSGVTKLGFDSDYEQNLGLLSMVSISRMIAAKDFSGLLQSCDGKDEAQLYYFQDTAKSITKVDYDAVKYVIIQQCENDFLCGVPIENKEDPFDATTFSGALRNSVKNLQSGIPDATIFLATPIFAPIEYEDDECLVMADYGGGTIEDYVEAVLIVASEFNLPIVDFYHDSGLDRTYKEIYRDGLHPDVPANEYMAACMWSAIQKFENENK